MMGRKFLLTLSFVSLIFLLNKKAIGQDSIQARIILIGDAGDLKKGRHPVLSAVREKAKLDKKTTVIYLGDNLYSTGLPDEQAPLYDIRRAILDSQVSIADKTEAKVYFIPGNHDWNRGHAGGWDAILREAAYIDTLSGRNVSFLPAGGCPGPVEVSLSADVTMVIFDSQWWIHQYDKPGIESDCPYKTKLEVLSQLEDILARNSKKLVILACHHPFKSYGIHGGYFTLKQHIFPLTEMWRKLYIPLPGLGSIYPIARGVFGTPQDLNHPEYANMIKDVQEVAKQHSNLIFVAGHEHNLQLIKDSSYHYIVSGSGTKSTRVSQNKNAPFTSKLNGFAVLEVSKNKNVQIKFHTVDKDSVATPYNAHLLNFYRPENPADSVVVKVIPTTRPVKDSVVVAANPGYFNVSKGRRVFLGDNYREEWATAIHLKLFNINKEKGGLKIVSLGGGKQTRSLRLVDKKGREWTLRTVNKDPEKAIPEQLRGSLAQDIVQDMISAAHPYAPLTIPPLARAAGIPVPVPEFFFIPDDPDLGIYRSMFANTVCMLEEREPGTLVGNTKSTSKVINELLEDNEHHVDQEAVLNARLLDMLVGDWDRHFDQWRFGTGDTGKGKLYYPIARDRDQAYFLSDGILIKRISKNLMPFLKGFRATIPKIEWLAWEARDFDRLFMNNINAEKWKEIVDDFCRSITDSVIENAIGKLPPEIYKINGAEIINKLKSRRDLLKDRYAMRYYNFLAKEVDVIGSNKDEYFKISRDEDDKGMQLNVYKRKANNDSGSLMFSRAFKDAETKEVRLYGLNGNDFFNIDPDVYSNIKVRLIGGRGNDTFNVQSVGEKYIYDLASEKNFIQAQNNTKNYFNDDPVVHRYDITGYRYNYHRFPQINIGFNPEDKLLLGIGYLSRRFGFRKEPYAMQHRLTTLYAVNRGSYQLKYNGEFNQVIKNKFDLVANAEIVHPTLNNFFGLGNNTTNERGREYYRVRYNYAQAELLLRNRLKSVVNVYIGPHIYNYWNRPEDNINKILSNPSSIGLDSAGVYATKLYLGGKLGFLINNLNNELLPTRGVLWHTEFFSQYGLTKQSKNLSRFTSDLTLYSSLRHPAKLVSVLRLGGGHIFSKNFEYFQALNIGANNFLRGFRKNRFSGSGLAYGSIELRVKLFTSKSYVLPGDIGLIGFNDLGKVWVRNETSKKWHHSYGGGLYYSAYNLALVSATVGFSEEEKLFNFTIGTKFNITF